MSVPSCLAVWVLGGADIVIIRYSDAVFNRNADYAVVLASKHPVHLKSKKLSRKYEP